MNSTDLTSLLSTTYERKTWLTALNEIFKTGDVFREPSVAELPNKDKWKQAWQLGSFVTHDDFDIAVFEIELSDSVDLDRNRVGLRNLLRGFYKETDGIFAVFKQHNRWRFSFISSIGEYDAHTDQWAEYETEPKRYTYLLGEGETVKTATERFGQLVGQMYVSYEDIKEAFSVEKLNKEFYEKVVRCFYRLIGAKEAGRGGTQHPHLLKLPSVSDDDKQTHQEFAVRLIGRTVFCWFLKFKRSKQGNPIIPAQVLGSASVGEHYYHQYLERLFFQVMNTPINNRRDDLPEDIRQIPFLNGGLFEPHTQDYYRADEHSGISINAPTLQIPDSWFKELFEVLEQYNFTIDENSVEDADVSVDPEMLGRIFENLLAEIDPDSGETARKATGSFYTPREIVNYMVDESLSKFIYNRTGVAERRLLPLLRFDTEASHDLSDEETENIIKALNSLKMLDPAAGSGAFPMGILQKTGRILEKLDPQSERWKELQLQSIPNPVMRRIMRERLVDATVEYARKLGIVQNSIYGVDIQPVAAEISKLRFFLSLVVDENVDEQHTNWGIEPLPNLEFKFVTANSLVTLPKPKETQTDAFSQIPQYLQKLQEITESYLQASGDEKAELKKAFYKTQAEISKEEQKGTTGKQKNERASMLSSWDPFDDSPTHWFDSKLMFGVSQFDIVIGNPPYGGHKIDDALKKELGLGSKDPYGAFIARFLPHGKDRSPLRHQGLLCFIVSDTFMTIKSHRPLRSMLMENYIHKMIRVHPDTFKATVNTAIIVCERNEFPLQNKKPVFRFDDMHTCLMADLTRTSIHEQHDRFVSLLERTIQYQHLVPKSDTETAKEENGVLYMRQGSWTSESSEEYGIYTYPQTVIERNSNKPFFVASPKLFRLMHDVSGSAKTKTVKTDNGTVKAKLITINNNEVSLVRLGDIAEVKQGLATGDNSAYLFQKPEARGNYRSIYDNEDYLLTEDDLNAIREDEELRLKVIEHGISKEDKDSERYFEGRYVIPHDKGGQSDIKTGWLPNYYVETNYFIDWSEWSVKRINTLADENGKLKSRFQNTSYYFQHGIDYSQTGIYSPTFRINSGTVFNTEATSIFGNFEIYSFLGQLCSKMNKFFIKNFIDSTVHASADKLKETVFTYKGSNKQLKALTNSIVEKQNIEGYYDYGSHEQLEIDKLVYKAYGLNKFDIREVENWYARRYPRLVAAQKENLRKLGKSDDYLELYGHSKEENN